MIDFWLKPALLGVQQPVTPTGAGADLENFLAGVMANEDGALGFSRGVGVLAACSLAAVSLGAPQSAHPAPAPADSRMLHREHPWTRALQDAFTAAAMTQGFETRLQYEACVRLAAADVCLPARLLPAALEAGRRSVALRTALLPVLGARGRWLAQYNPSWKYAAASADAASTDAGPDAAVWQNGSHIDRLAYFRALRARDAAAAAELLRAGLGELPAKERIEFVGALETQLAAGDQSLLELLLKDRSRELRAMAARMLACLARSAHAQQLTAWLTPRVTSERKLFVTRWLCEAPEQADPAWAAAAIEVKRPASESLGERAWWLYQLVRQVPLSWWCQHTGMSASELVAWSSKTDWTAALLRAWVERAGREDIEWIAALLAHKSREVQWRSAELLALLPLHLRERYWPDQLPALVDAGVIADVIGSCALGETLSLNYSRALYTSLVEAFSQDRLRHDYGQRATVLELAALLHPESLRGATPVVRALDETPAMSECALAFDRIVRVRLALHAPS